MSKGSSRVRIGVFYLPNQHIKIGQNRVQPSRIFHGACRAAGSDGEEGTGGRGRGDEEGDEREGQEVGRCFVSYCTEK